MSDPETQALQEAKGDGSPAPTSFRSAPIEELAGQVNDIQNVMEELMTEGTHYDDVTGDGRNSLMQPGAEKLCFAFKFSPSFDVERRDYAPEEVPNADEPVEGHREYIVNCELHHRPTGQYVGSGRGSCSTLESKYRYRKIDQTTDVPIPGEFWDSYDDSMADADFSILEEELKANGVDIPEGGEAGVTKNDDGEWRITVKAKGENPDIADQYNTVLKMAEKRALVNAVKRSTAASDIFTQDTEDLAQLDGSNVRGQRKRSPSSGKAQRGTRTNGSTSQTGSADTPQKQQADQPTKVEWESPYGQAFTIRRGKAGSLQSLDEALQEEDGADLAAKIEKVRSNWEWGGTEGKALDDLLKWHEGRIDVSGKANGNGSPQDTKTSPTAQENGTHSGAQPTTSDDYDGPEDALSANFDEAWAEGKEGWDSISEAQLNRLYAIADENEWGEAGLNRLVKDELGWESKADLPYGDPYDEVCEALEDDRLRYYMYRDPDTPDMFEEEDANDEAFEDGADSDDLPF